MNTCIFNPFKHSAALALALCLAAVGLQNSRADQTNTYGQLTAKDYKFVTDAFQGGSTEATLGQLAVQKASDQSVRDFGQRMVTDHQKANQELTALVSQKGATLPDAATKKSVKMVQHLQNLSGHEFDHTYMMHMVSDHKSTIKEFQTAADQADDADLKNWAAKTLPTLQAHLSLAQSVQATVDAARPQASATP